MDRIARRVTSQAQSAYRGVSDRSSRVLTFSSAAVVAVVPGAAFALSAAVTRTSNQAVEATSTQRTVSRLQTRGCRVAVGGRASPRRSVQEL